MRTNEQKIERLIEKAKCHHSLFIVLQTILINPQGHKARQIINNPR